MQLLQIPHDCLSEDKPRSLDSRVGVVSRQALYSLKMLPVWVSPEHLVSTARFVLHGHRLTRLPIVGADGVIGYVTAEALATQSGDFPVGELAEAFTLVLEGSTSVQEAADRFIEARVEAAPVVHRGRFLGIITTFDLLRELRQTIDPLTELPGLDRLRNWAVDQLSHGLEITLICLDLDDFGLYNRRYGHSQGDLLLRRYAERFRATINPDTDLLVKFGGDEFLVGTVRSLEESQALSGALRESTQRISLPDILEPVTFSIGISGGKRTQERENTHYEAMFDNLVKLAQSDCQAHKRLKPGVVTSAVVSTGLDRPQEFEVISVAQHREPQPLTQVIIRIGSRIVGGVDGGEEPNMAVANATARALESWSRTIVLAIEDIQRFDDAGGSQLVSATGSLSVSGEASRIAGSAKVDSDLPRAIAESVLDAFARSGASAERR